MLLAAYLILALYTVYVEGSNPCNNVAHTFYRKLKCVPEMTPGSSCPASYKCDHLLKRDREMCYLFGREYTIGSTVSRSKVDFETPCIETCTCNSTEEGARFSCQLGRGQAECEPLPQECRRHMFEESLSCCKKSFVTCDKDPSHRKNVKCTFNNKTYTEGERFFPTSDVTCTQCICADGFNGSIASPFCAPTDCPLELWGDTPYRLTQGCIPVYLSAQGCCPVMFRCPNTTDSVVKAEKTVSSSQKDLSCTFGQLKLQIGDRLSPWAELKDVECRCDIPPLPVCVKTNLVLTADMIRMINQNHQH